MQQMLPGWAAAPGRRRGKFEDSLALRAREGAGRDSAARESVGRNKILQRRGEACVSRATRGRKSRAASFIIPDGGTGRRAGRKKEAR